jgi:UDP:flavonoid glycosyltransferase YjiC (YdhE family)
MKRVYVGVYGVGLGHASRMVHIADMLDDRLLKFSSFGDATDYINAHGYSCIKIPPVELGWNPELGFAVKESITRIPTNIINFTSQCGKEANSIGKFRPNLVVSDTRLSSLIIAKLYNMPTLTILNQIKLLLSNGLRTFSITRLFEDILAEFLGLFWNSSDEIFIPDLPPPYTISEENLWNINTISNRLRYIGFLAKPTIDEEKIRRVNNMLALDNKPIIFAHISGPITTKLLVIRRIIDTLKDRDDINLIVSEGKPNGDIRPKRIKNGWYYEWCPVRDEIFALSNLLIVRGGHSTLAQAILYGKPVISIPIENHGEQIGNARKVAKLGLGMMLRQNEVAKLNECIDLILLNENYNKKASKIKKVAERLDGTLTIIDKIKEY